MLSGAARPVANACCRAISRVLGRSFQIRMKSLLEARRLPVAFGNGRSRLKAVDQVDLQLLAGTTLGLVGESGSGKSTLGRALAGLVRVASGSVYFAGKDVTN